MVMRGGIEEKEERRYGERDTNISVSLMKLRLLRKPQPRSFLLL